MTAVSGAISQAGRPAGLLEKLLAVIRPEFRLEVLVFEPRDPVFGGPPCAVPECDRPGRCRQMCWSHSHRWMMAGKPDPAVFAATTSPGWAGHSPLPGCQITGCGYALAGHGLCYQHLQRWDRAGRPDLVSWQTTTSPPSAAPGRLPGLLLHLVGQADLGVLPQPPQALAPGLGASDSVKHQAAALSH